MELNCFGEIEPPIGNKKSGVEGGAIVGKGETGMPEVVGVVVITLVSQDYCHQRSPFEFLLESP